MPSGVAFRSDVVDAIMSTRDRGTPGWSRQLIEGYLDLRRSRYDGIWEKVEELYRKDGDYVNGWFTKDPTMIQGRMIRPPRVYGYIQALESQLYTRHPRFFVSPMAARQEKLARYGQAHLNAHWKRDRTIDEDVHLMLRDTAKTGFAWALTEFVAQDPVKAQRDNRKRQKFARDLQESGEMGALAADLIAEQALGRDSVAFKESSVTYERDDRVIYGKVVTRRIPYWAIAVDPNAGRLEDAEWVYRQVFAPIDAVKRCPFFKNTEDLRPTAQLSGSFDGKGVTHRPLDSPFSVPEPYQYVILWEGYEKNEDGGWDFKVFAENHPEWLYEEKDRYHLGCPYTLLRWNHEGDTIFAPSDIQEVLDLIGEEMNLRTRLFDSEMRKMEDAWAFDQNVIKEPTLAAAMNIPGVGTFMPVPGLSARGKGTVFQELPKNQNSQSLLAYLAIIERNIELGTGMGANQSLSAMKSDTSATESAEVAAWARSRSEVKHFWFKRAMEDIGLKILQQSAQWLGPDVISQTAGPDAGAFWAAEEWTPADIRYGLAVEIEQGSMRPPSDEAKAQLLATMIQEAMTNPIAAQKYNVDVMLEDLARFRGIQDGSKYLNPDFTPEKMAEMSMMMSLMGGKMGGGGSPAAPQGMGNAEAVREGAQVG